jgi:hypothetical protein
VHGAFHAWPLATTATDKRALHDRVLAGQADGLWFRPRAAEPALAGPTFPRRQALAVRVDRRDPDDERAFFAEIPRLGARQWHRVGRVVLPAGAGVPPSCTWVEVSTRGDVNRFLDAQYLGTRDAPARAAQVPPGADWGDADNG